MKRALLMAAALLFLVFFREREIDFRGQTLTSAEHCPGQLVVQIREGTDPRELTRELLAGISRNGRIREISGTPYLLCEFSPSEQAAADRNVILRRLRNSAEVSGYSLNYLVRLAEVTPDDQNFRYQYWLKNSGQQIHEEDNVYGTSGADIKATHGWEWSTGDGAVLIAVIDTGIFFEHEDLRNRVVTGYDFVSDKVAATDNNGHGTAVSSVIAAETNNQLGVAGVSWNSRIMPLKAFNKDGVGTLLAVATAIRYAADNGAQVINLGLTLEIDSPILEDACRYAFEKGAVLVAAAGNGSGNVSYPAAYDDYVLAVSATDENDIFANFSNFGPQVDVAAPGSYIFCASYDVANPSNHRYYAYYKQGTSFAAAMVSGAAALLLESKPFLSNSEICQLIRFTAADINSQNHPGKDVYLGYGRLDLKTLLEPYQLQQ